MNTSAVTPDAGSGDKPESPLENFGGINSPEKLSQQLRGDLDNIVMMALRKEPQRRYASVEKLATDIQRHLDHLPVSATKDTFRYRAAKFVRRHRAGVVAAFAVALALIAGLAATLYEARIARVQQLRAERRFNDVRKLANSLMFEIHDSIRDLPGSTAARKLLVDRALQYLDSLYAEGGNDPSLMRELGFAYERVGDVQGYFFFGNVGDTSGALKSYQKAMAIRETLARNHPKDSGAQADLASSYQKMADALYSVGDKVGAMQKTRQVVAIRQALVALDPESPHARSNLASAHIALGDSLIDALDWPAATAEYKEALTQFEQLAAEHPESIEFRRMAGIAHHKIGFVYERTAQLPAARNEYTLALKVFQQLASANPTNTLVQRNLSFGYLNNGDMAVAAGDPHGIRDFLEAAKICEAIAAKDPANRRIDRDISLIYGHLGDAEKKFGKLQLALQFYQRGVEAAKRRSASDPGNLDAAQALANRYQSLGNLYVTMAKDRVIAGNSRRIMWQNARSSFQKALSFWLDPKLNSSLSPSDAKPIDELQRSIRECDQALKKPAA
jgi:eukaryotic-like serine/threonine-protein kinase